MKKEEINRFIADQRRVWPLCDKNFSALDQLQLKLVSDSIGHPIAQVRFNPARMASSTAKASTVAVRPCFLCRANRPSEQMALLSGDYEILVNPFPIFPIHLTLAAVDHEPQTIGGRIGEMVRFAAELSDLTIFYNGPCCGASAPDHHHFQAADFEIPKNLHRSNGPVSPFMTPLTAGIEIISDDYAFIESTVTRVMNLLPQANPEPMVNILCRQLSDGRTRCVVIPRRRHRPDCYGDVLISPASVEMAGYVVAPRPEDFDAVTPELLRLIFNQVSFTNDEIISLWNRL